MLNPKEGHIILVGAGPGDEELITLKAVKALESADVIFYDALINTALLNHAPAHCEFIFAGKRASKHFKSQANTNHEMVMLALKGKTVVRLKGGDPFIFARGKEEMDYAQKCGISVSVIPGISALNTAGIYGVPLTKRGVNESFWVVTATTSDGGLSKDMALAAQSSATVVIFMGLKKLKQIIGLFSLHRSEETPVFILSKGSEPEAQLIKSSIAHVIEAHMHNPVEAPAIILIGDVLTQNEEEFNSETYSLIEHLKKNEKVWISS